MVADVLADPRARIQKRRSDCTAKQAFYRLADELRDTILVACSKCDWKEPPWDCLPQRLTPFSVLLPPLLSPAPSSVLACPV
jgi:hypothetical protein